MCFHVVVDNLEQFELGHDAVSLNSFAVSNTLNTFTSCKHKKLWIWTYKSPNIGVKNFSPVGPIAGFHKSLNVEHCIFAPSGVSRGSFKMLFFCLLVSQNEHFTGISVYFMDIMGDCVSMLQWPIQPRSQPLSSCGAKTLVDAGHVIC
jgi:hypothetical protein